MVKDAENPWYEVTLIEGKNRQIRRMFEEIGHHVEKIKRVRYGNLTLDVEPGQFRELSGQEVAALRKAKPQPAAAPQKSAARAASRFIGKARIKSQEQERFRPRKGRSPTHDGRSESMPRGKSSRPQHWSAEAGRRRDRSRSQYGNGEARSRGERSRPPDRSTEGSRTSRL